MLCMLVSMLAYQLSASFAKYLFTVLDPTSVTVLRLCFASIFVGLMLRSWRIFAKLKYIQWRNLLCYSFALGCMNMMFYHALVLLPQGIAVGLEFVGPLGLALFAVQKKSDVIWVIFAMIGVVLLMPWSGHDNISWLGVVLALGAGFCWALYIYFGQKVIRQNLGMHSLTLAIGLAALIWLPVGLWNNAQGILNVQYWGYAAALAILATSIPYALDLYALKYLNRLSYGTFTSLSPAVAALAGLLLLNEHLSILQWFALFCIMLASIGISIRNYYQVPKQGESGETT
ncbi:MAG: EamA family transporter [Acinetobacter populi]|uniref:EamA family transporter n=1 Tax=Acinetobacter populi TaxID=1582270 RepID=UPI002353FA50|nr:EamA family transporter [Acinetobacter populi]MCH4247935.1 EamA family transporter [Acinetobacter populi]